MRLRATKVRPSVPQCRSATNELVRAMTYRMYGAFIASLSAVALIMLAANESLARSGAAPRGGFTSTHSISHRSVAQSLRRFRRRNAAIVWPAVGDDFYGSSYGYG